jgi:hypothetical protein
MKNQERQRRGGPYILPRLTFQHADWDDAFWYPIESGEVENKSDTCHVEEVVLDLYRRAEQVIHKYQLGFWVY